MGYSASREARGMANHLFSGGNWRVVSVEDHKRIMRSAEGVEADEYNIGISHDYSVRDELEIYSYRKTQDLPLVRIVSVEVRDAAPASGFCQGGVLNLSAIVRTERIQQTLADAPQISFPEALYVLSESVIGYRELYNKVGPFEITDRMIGFTPQGFVKVWMNENFGLNHPSIERVSPLQTTNYLPGDNLVRRTEVDMVKNLVRVVEYHTENGSFPNSWEIEELAQPYMTFQDLHRLVQGYVRNNQVFVPDRISDGRILRITKTRNVGSVMPQSGGVETTTVTETVNVQPTLVQTVTTAPNFQPMVVQNVVRPPQVLSGAVYRGPMIRQPQTVYNVMPAPVLVGGSRLLQGNIAQPALVSGDRPVVVGTSRISARSGTPVAASPSSRTNPAMQSPPSLVSHPSQEMVIQSFQPPPPPSFVPQIPPPIQDYEFHPAPLPNNGYKEQIIEQVYEVPSNPPSAIRNTQGFNNAFDPPAFSRQSINQLPVISMDPPPTLPPPFLPRPGSLQDLNFPGQNINLYNPPAFDTSGSNLYHPPPLPPLPPFNFADMGTFNNPRQESVLVSKLSSDYSSEIRRPF